MKKGMKIQDVRLFEFDPVQFQSLLRRVSQFPPFLAEGGHVELVLACLTKRDCDVVGRLSPLQNMK